MQEQQLRRIDRFRSIHCRENDSLMAANLLEPAYLLEQTQVQIPPAHQMNEKRRLWTSFFVSGIHEIRKLQHFLDFWASTESDHRVFQPSGASRRNTKTVPETSPSCHEQIHERACRSARTARARPQTQGQRNMLNEAMRPDEAATTRKTDN